MAAGTDTTSSALSRILYLLCLHPGVQEKLRTEVVAAGGAKGGLDHDALHGLEYLEAVCRETLRLYPPVNFVQRWCVSLFPPRLLSPDQPLATQCTQGLSPPPPYAFPRHGREETHRAVRP